MTEYELLEALSTSSDRIANAVDYVTVVFAYLVAAH